MYKNSFGKKIRRIFFYSFLFKVINFFHGFSRKLLMRTVKVHHDPQHCVRTFKRCFQSRKRSLLNVCLTWSVLATGQEILVCLTICQDHRTPTSSQVSWESLGTKQTKSKGLSDWPIRLKTFWQIENSTAHWNFLQSKKLLLASKQEAIASWHKKRAHVYGQSSPVCLLTFLWLFTATCFPQSLQWLMQTTCGPVHKIQNSFVTWLVRQMTDTFKKSN